MFFLVLYSIVLHIIIPHVDANNSNGHDDHLDAWLVSSWGDIGHRLSHIKHCSFENYSINSSQTKSGERKTKQVEKNKFFLFFTSVIDGYTEIVSPSKARHEGTDALQSCIIHTLSRRGPPIY